MSDNRKFTLPDPPVYVSDQGLQNTTDEQKDSTGSSSLQGAVEKMQSLLTALHTIVSFLLRDTEASKNLFESLLESNRTEIARIRTTLSELTATRQRTVVETEHLLVVTTCATMVLTLKQDIAEDLCANTEAISHYNLSQQFVQN